MEQFCALALDANGVDEHFDDIIEPLLPELMEAAAVAQVADIKYDETVSITPSAMTCCGH